MISINALTSALARRCSISTSVVAAASAAPTHLNTASTRSSSATANSVTQNCSSNNEAKGLKKPAIQISSFVPCSLHSPHVSLGTNKTGMFCPIPMRSMSSLASLKLNIGSIPLQLQPNSLGGSKPNKHDHKYNPTFLPASPTTLTQKRTFASKKHKRIIKMAKGYRGRANRTFRAAIRRVEKGLQYAYRDRKVKKRNFRKLWIERVNAGVRQHGMSYSKFIHGMQNLDDGAGAGAGSEESTSGEHKILLNRKVLADLAANEPFSFKAVVDVVKMKSNANANGSRN